MTGSTSLSTLLAAAALASLVVGCTSSGGGVSASSCADVVEFDHRTYMGLADVDFTTGAEAGAAGQVFCNDTGGDDVEETVFDRKAYEIEGLDPGDAVAVGEARDDARFYALHEGDGELPAAVQKLIDQS
jgi:hypothetical protein